MQSIAGYDVVIEYVPTRYSQTKFVQAQNPDDATEMVTREIVMHCCDNSQEKFDELYRVRSIYRTMRRTDRDGEEEMVGV